MPTTKEETLYISKIIDESLAILISGYIESVDKDFLEAKQLLTRRLAEEIGYLTVNYSVRKSLFDLCKHYNPDWKVSDDIINKLIKAWYDNKNNQTVSIDEFVGLSYEEWEDYVRRNSSIY